MHVEAVRVRNHKSIEDTGWVSLDGLTCLIGRNESGKTAFLRAIERFNPAYGGEEFDFTVEYPRDELSAYRDGHDDDPDVVASVRVSLEPEDREQLEAELEAEVPSKTTFVVSVDYANEFHWELSDESDFDLDPDIVESTAASVLADRLPTFQYIGEYTVLPGRLSVEQLLEREAEGALEPGDEVFLSLASIAGIDLDALHEGEESRRERIAELEAASRRVTDAAMSYWSQSGNIRLRIDLVEEDGEGILEVRVEDVDADVSVEFDSRSQGFRWFVSTFCTLYDSSQSDQGPVLLLDEPGLNLQPRAKHEFRSFLEEAVAGDRPVVYTTHSPHMIDPESVHRVQTIRANPPSGPNVTNDPTMFDPDSRFLLQNVIELGVIDAMLARPQTLLVNERADQLFVQNVSELFRATGSDDPLDSRWTIVPVHGEANVPWFVTLIDAVDLDVAALLSDREPIDSWLREGDHGVRSENVVTIDEFADVRAGAGTVEDLLSTEAYLDIVNEAYATELREAGIDRLTTDHLPSAKGNGIIDRVTTAFERAEVADERFDREVPAEYFFRHREEFAETINDMSRRGFSQLFRQFNDRISTFEGVSKRRKTFLETLGFR